MEETYICLECKKIFEEPKTYVEDLTPGYNSEGGWFRHEYYACPYCEGAYRNAVKCDICDEYVNSEEVEYIDNERICKKCIDQLEEK